MGLPSCDVCGLTAAWFRTEARDRDNDEPPRFLAAWCEAHVPPEVRATR